MLNILYINVLKNIVYLTTTRREQEEKTDDDDKKELEIKIIMASIAGRVVMNAFPSLSSLDFSVPVRQRF